MTIDQLAQFGVVYRAIREVCTKREQDNDRAISDYTAAIRLDPLYIDAYKNRAGAYRALGHEANAVSDESKVSELMQWRGGTLSSS